jgi:hypothetical protein
LLQAPVLVGLALCLEPLHLPGDLAFVLLAAGSVSACFALTALFTRIRHGTATNEPTKFSRRGPARPDPHKSGVVRQKREAENGDGTRRAIGGIRHV